MTELPFVDEHAVRIGASRDDVWLALLGYAGSLGVGPRHPLALLLGTDPPAGFAVTRELPGELLDLSGRHRFSRYLLQFALSDGGPGETILTARTFATFPGLHGRAYRALVIGSRGHVLAVRAMLRSVKRASLR